MEKTSENSYLRKNLVLMICPLIFAVVWGVAIFGDEFFLQTLIDPMSKVVAGRTLTGRGASFRYIGQILIFILGLASYFVLSACFQFFFQRKRTVLSIIFFVVFLSAVFYPVVFLADHMRLAMDDFGFFNAAGFASLWDSIVVYYQHWSGRYMMHPLFAVSSLLPAEMAVRVAPVLIVWFLWLGLFLILRMFFLKDSGDADLCTRRFGCWIAASGITMAILCCTPEIFSSLYWFTSGIIYALGLALTFIFAYCMTLVSRSGTKKYFITALIMSFMICGMNELSAISLCVFSGSFLLYERLFHSSEFRGSARWLALSTIVFTAVSFAAPGNFVRMNLIKEESDVSFLYRALFDYFPELIRVNNAFYLSAASRIQYYILFFFVFFSLGLLLPVTKEAIRTMVWGFGTMQAAIFFCFGANISGFAPERIFIIPTAWLVCLTAAAAFLCGAFVPRLNGYRQQAAAAALAVILILFASGFFLQEHRAASKQFAAEYDFRAQQLMTADQSAEYVDTCIAAVPGGEISDISPDSGWYVNDNMARYFSLNAIRGIAPCSEWIKEGG